MLKFSLIIISCTIKTRRFILRGSRLPSLLSLGVYTFIHLDLGIALGLLKPREISGLVVGIVTGSTIRFLRNRATISQDKKTYPLSSQMTPLYHEMDVSSSCGPEDADFATFIEVTSLIGSRDAAEEFLASGLWPLGRHFGFSMETKESPLSKVIVPMPQIGTAIREQESGAKFVAKAHPSAQEVVAAKPLGRGNKLLAKTSGLTVQRKLCSWELVLLRENHSVH
jgi:hypothetical protein